MLRITGRSSGLAFLYILSVIEAYLVLGGKLFHLNSLLLLSRSSLVIQLPGWIYGFEGPVYFPQFYPVGLGEIFALGAQIFFAFCFWLFCLSFHVLG